MRNAFLGLFPLVAGRAIASIAASTPATATLARRTIRARFGIRLDIGVERGGGSGVIGICACRFGRAIGRLGFGAALHGPLPVAFRSALSTTFLSAPASATAAATCTFTGRAVGSDFCTAFRRIRTQGFRVEQRVRVRHGIDKGRLTTGVDVAGRRRHLRRGVGRRTAFATIPVAPATAAVTSVTSLPTFTAFAALRTGRAGVGSRQVAIAVQA